MQSRMDRYNKDNDSTPKRSEKNVELYRNLNHSSYADYESLPIPENSNIIDLNKLKKNLDNRIDYKQAQKINMIARPTINQEPQPIPKRSEEEVYDINQMIEKARREKEKLKAVQKKILDTNYNFLSSLESNKEMEEPIETSREEFHKTSSVELKPIEEEALLKTTTSLSLDILEDLKPSVNDDKVVSMKIEPKKETNNNDFYSTSYTFSKKDFEDEEEESPKKGTGIKILLVFILLATICGAIYFILKYFDIKIIS